MISKDKQYRTRNGREVRIYATDGCRAKVHGAMLIDEGWEHRSWMSDGRIQLCQEHEFDLIEVRPRHKLMVWMNVSAKGGAIGYQTKELADEWEKLANHRRIACIKVELDFEEGEGL